MKKEQRIQIFTAAEKKCQKYDNVKLAPDPRVIASPDAYWVSAWIRVPLTAVQDQQVITQTVDRFRSEAEEAHHAVTGK